MAIFGRGKAEGGRAQAGAAGATPLVARQAFCRICDDYREFTKCWQRTEHLKQCPCCGVAFDDPAGLYRRNQPMCPRCGEYLEQPGFEYGLCDGCGSKFEFVTGGKPGLLPNYKQREEMNKHGKAWSPD